MVARKVDLSQLYVKMCLLTFMGEFMDERKLLSLFNFHLVRAVESPTLRGQSYRNIDLNKPIWIEHIEFPKQGAERWQYAVGESTEIVMVGARATLEEILDLLPESLRSAGVTEERLNQELEQERRINCLIH